VKNALYIRPPRTEEFTDRILDTGYFNRSYDIIVEDIVEGDAIIGEGYEVRPFEVEHGINAFGFVLRKKPRKRPIKIKWRS